MQSPTSTDLVNLAGLGPDILCLLSDKLTLCHTIALCFTPARLPCSCRVPVEDVPSWVLSWCVGSSCRAELLIFTNSRRRTRSRSSQERSCITARFTDMEYPAVQHTCSVNTSCNVPGGSCPQQTKELALISTVLRGFTSSVLPLAVALML